MHFLSPIQLQSCLLLLLLTISIYTYAQQNERYNLRFENSPLKEVLSEITILTGYEFAYSDTEVRSSRKISVSARQKTAEELILIVAGNAGLEALFTEKKVILKLLNDKQFYIINGIVIEALNDLPIPGAHVFITCKTSGTFTDEEGRYSLKVPKDCNTVRFSCMGFTEQEQIIRTDTLLNIRLQADIKTLSETVVVAFGEEPEDLLTGAVSFLRMDLYDQTNSSSLNAAMQSEISGLLIQANGGTPASGFNINIRGISSINAGNRPLFVVDGIPIITGDYSQLDFSGQSIDAISDLSINDIESISVLKDAAASSLFGSNSSNGVILINTKRGVSGRNRIDLYSYFGLQQTVGRLDMLDSRQWMNLMNEQALAEGRTPEYSQETLLNYPINTDWQQEVFRTAPTRDIGLSLSGGNDKSQHYISGNFFDQEGIIIGSDFKRYNLRMNYDYKISEKLKIESGNSFAYSVNNRVEGDQTLNGPLPNAISLAPVFPVYNSDGSFNNDGSYANPVAIATLEKNLTYTYRNTFHFKANYALADNFTLRSLTGLDFYNLREQAFAPKTTRQGAKYNGLGIEATSNALRFYHTTYLDYSLVRSLNRLSVTAGLSLESNRQHDTFLRAQNFAGTSFEFLQDAATPVSTQSYETEANANSLFSRIQYGYDERYIFTLNLRRDGSSKFGKNNRFGLFPSFSGLWYASKEEFFKVNAISRLILSVSYGITGNDQIGDFLSLDLYSAGNNYGGDGGISPSQLANPNLRWESTSHFNLGTQIELFGRINIRADYYNKQTKDLLLQKPMPTSTGHAFVMSNIGKIENQGVEISAIIPIIEGPFRWDAMLNFTSNRNKVLELYEDQPIRNIGRASSSIEVGEPVSFFYGFNSLGVNPDDGNLIYEDLNGDGKINDLDRKKIGSPHPVFYGGVGSNLSWKNFSFDFRFSFSYGNSIFNSTRIYTETISLSNQTTAILRRWQNPGDITDVPKASVYNQRFSSRFVEDGSFLRLKNVRFSYELPEKLISRAGISRLEVFVAGKNLLTFTRYSGMDPEINYNGLNPIALGTDFFTCPQPKSLMIGLCARF